MVANNDKFKLAGVYNPVVTEKNVNEVAEFADLDVPVYTDMNKFQLMILMYG